LQGLLLSKGVYKMLILTKKKNTYCAVSRRSTAAQPDLPLQLCWLATEGTQESGTLGSPRMVVFVDKAYWPPTPSPY